MTFERATLHVLSTYPREGYLQDEDILFIEATNVSSEIITRAAFRDLLNDLETRRLAVSESAGRRTKWKITAAGRAELKER